jgi:hypothetical protein
MKLQLKKAPQVGLFFKEGKRKIKANLPLLFYA